MTKMSLAALSGLLVACGGAGNAYLTQTGDSVVTFPAQVSVEGKKFMHAYANSSLVIQNSGRDLTGNPAPEKDNLVMHLPDQDQVFVEYTANNETVDQWSELLTITVAVFANTETPPLERLKQALAAQKPKGLVSSDVSINQAQQSIEVAWIFAPDEATPSYEVNSQVFYPTPSCGGYVSLAYAKKLAAGSNEATVKAASEEATRIVQNLDIKQPAICNHP
ncbi:hypothetical protein L0B52_01020 [Suttonella sp. R2A3]|uniref:hypothetical protein n=1 Tax=Suttonella sp. R2A3 TaxID=2908648 RepID=UPI001F22FD1E|nr:hypothetical protein [Suttonella sp. R2A3]UJF24749.1 hypothetical protein L0B52_01020 [Suttonella sp. R2A3]